MYVDIIFMFVIETEFQFQYTRSIYTQYKFLKIVNLGKLNLNLTLWYELLELIVDRKRILLTIVDPKASISLVHTFSTRNKPYKITYEELQCVIILRLVLIMNKTQIE